MQEAPAASEFGTGTMTAAPAVVPKPHGLRHPYAGTPCGYRTFRLKEERVEDRSRVMFAALIGAAAGAAWGYLYLTEGGRRVRSQIEPKLDDFMVELRRMRRTIEKARAAADESWRSLNDLAGGAAVGFDRNPPAVSH